VDIFCAKTDPLDVYGTTDKNKRNRDEIRNAGVYDAKPGGGFEPGGCSLHNTMLPHGPDSAAFEGASHAELKPHKQEGTLAFMFETRFPQRVTAYAAGIPELQRDYGNYGHDLKKDFDPARP